LLLGSNVETRSQVPMVQPGEAVGACCCYASDDARNESCSKDGSGFRWTSAFGEYQSLHIDDVLKDTCALQRFASRRTVGHGPRLLQRCQRLDLQVLLGPNIGFLLVHLKRLKQDEIRLNRIGIPKSAGF
jgi:hypothetical protein